jgi:hypothetical protein
MSQKIRMYCRTCKQYFHIHDPGAVHGHMTHDTEYQG